MTHTQTLIVGGGLSGLALADMLHSLGTDYLLVEARRRFGGRIETVQYDGGDFDLGPAWFWPGQPRIAALIARLGLQRFDQYAQGALSYEDAQGFVQRGRGFASMQGSWRLVGGLGKLTQSLADGLPDGRKLLGRTVTQITRDGVGVVATLSDGAQITADRVVLALPPRVAAHIAFSPVLPDATMAAMRNVPTWMAGQAKAVAVYDSPFWRAAGLSGDATSRHGPMVEIHDASPVGGGPYALFGFIGLPVKARQNDAALRQQIGAQLGRIFGPQAARPAQLFIKDWAADAHTATLADHAPVYAHPDYGLPPAMAQIWGGAVQFAGTEVAPEFGGYLEGALAAAQAVFDGIVSAGDDRGKFY